MMEIRLQEIASEEAAKIITPLLDSFKIDQNVDVDVSRLFQNLHKCTGFVVESQLGKWGFAHKTFQEYLTSVYWATTKPVSWSEKVGDNWWREALRFYAAKHDATQIVRDCLDKNLKTSLILATDICDQHPDKAGTEIRQMLKGKLYDNLESPDAESCRIAREVELTNYMPDGDDVIHLMCVG